MKKTNKTVYAFVFAAAVFFLVGVGEHAPSNTPEVRQPAPASLIKSKTTPIPAAPLTARDLIA